MRTRENMNFKFGDRVREIKSLCSDDEDGTIVDNGTYQKDGDIRYLVRWDGSSLIYGCHQSNIKAV